MCSSTMPAFNMSRRWIGFRSRNGTRSCRSICRRRFTPCGWRCRRCARTSSGASSISPPRMGWSPRRSRRPMSPPSTASSDLTKVAALETAEEGITCNAICPGYVYTPLVEAQIDGQAKAHGISARAGRSRRAAGAATQQALCDGRGTRRAHGISRRRRGGLDHWNRFAGRWWLDRALKYRSQGNKFESLANIMSMRRASNGSET